ncbi:MAG: peptidylglycine monooxygenase [Bacteroidota bacterium]
MWYPLGPKQQLQPRQLTYLGRRIQLNTIMPTRRTALRLGGLTAAGLLTLPNFAIGGKYLRPDDGIVGHGEFRYKVHKDWADVNRYQTFITNCHEMVMDSKGRLIMIGDDPRNNIIVFDKSGKVLDQWGTMYPGGHGLTINNEGGEDFLYIADSGFVPTGTEVKRQNGFVTKTKVDGTLLMMIGHPTTVGAYTPEMRFQPTETAVAPNGDIYVADGYGMNYILRYDRQGRFIQKFGGNNNADPNYNLASAHGIALDTRDPNNPRLIVTSRAEAAFKYFTLDGKWLKTVHLNNMQACRAVIDDDQLYAGVCWSHDFGKAREAGWDKPWLVQSGFTLVMDKNDQVISCPGGEQPIYQDGKLQRVAQNEAKTFYNGHDVCIDEDKNVYVCQWNGEFTPPIKLERV